MTKLDLSRNAMLNIQILTNVGRNITELKKENYGIIPIDAEKHLEKI